MKNFILAICLTFLSDSVNNADAEFSDFMKGYSALKSLTGSITQYIYNGPSVEKFSGEYSAVAGGWFRIDYLSPERQIVVRNSKGLYWYYPGKELVFVGYGGIDKNNNITCLPGISLSGSFRDVKIFYEGIRFYGFLKYAHVYSFCSGAEGGTVRIWFDPGRKYIVRKYITDSSGMEMMKEVYHEYFFQEGVPVPTVIELFARSDNGIVHTLTEYKDLVINAPINRRTFEFNVKKNMTLRRLNEIQD
ncbi:MAG TPA: hypothetical protein PK358_02205 [Spirochaetota bacterium]|nr:hypothetical protein [Spirochaetota bacterium]HPJ33618.1 hypothetical protein [Spirochaetota bacterium]